MLPTDTIPLWLHEPHFNITFRTVLSASSPSVNATTITGAHQIPPLAGNPTWYNVNGTVEC